MRERLGDFKKRNLQRGVTEMIDMSSEFVPL
jgi:hypothetical protein